MRAKFVSASRECSYIRAASYIYTSGVNGELELHLRIFQRQNSAVFFPDWLPKFLVIAKEIFG